MAVQHGHYPLFQAFCGVLRAVAEVEVHQAFPGDDVAANTGLNAGYLECGRREEIVAVVPEFLCQGIQCRCHGVHRVFRHVRVGYVALYPVYGQVAVQGATAAVLDDVAHLVRTRRLADQAPVHFLVSGFQGFHHLYRAILGRAFFVAGDQQRDRAPVVRVVRHKAFAGGYEGGQAAFHIRSAPAVQVTVFDHRLKWRVGPVLLRASRNHIGMAGKGQHRPL